MTPATTTRKLLTDRTIKALRTPGKIRDTQIPQLELRIRTSGAKNWSIRYRMHGKPQRRLTLGSYPAMELAEARKKAKAAIRKIEDGHDPRVEQEARRAADTVGELAELYINKYAKKIVNGRFQKRSWKEDQRILTANVLPRWKDWLARDVTRRDVRTLVEEIADRAPVMANRTTALLSKLFAFAVDQEIVDASPVVKIPRTKEKSRDRVLSYDEIRKFWADTESFAAPMRALWRLRLLTLQRLSEIADMTWANVDIEGGIWTIPADDAKNGLSHRVPLSQPVIDLLKTLPRGDDDDDYVLGGARGTRQIVEAKKKINLDDFRGHDLRRTASTELAKAGIPRLVFDKLLNHKDRTVAGIYDRYAYDPQKKLAMDTWARTLDAILTAKPGTVLPFAKAE